ncbi:glycosyltransferase family 2 protein [Holophaga foetida]|uniref:glycosyltransferase family 2 protein n=1 Tax=Holophaga foetida TaxID=35839 RepID=UPI00047B5855|nr:glycosyltransferase [Holophaga foetida]
MGFVERELTTVIVTHNSAAVLSDCLASLKRCASGPVLVVDNGSTDGSAELARAAGAVVHELGQNTGFAKAANHGARAAQSPFLCFLNPDCAVDAHLLEIAAEMLRQHKQCIALPSFLHDDGITIQGCQPGYTWEKLLADVLENNRNWPRVVRLIKRLPGYDAQNWQWPLCACAFIAKDVFLGLGGFDEHYFLYMEDVELGLSMLRAGGVVAALDATVRHHAQTGSAVSPDRRLRMLNTARLQYARRHYGACFEWLLRLLVPQHRRTATQGAI